MAPFKKKIMKLTLDLLNKDFKSTFLNMLKKLMKTMSKELKEARRMIYEQNENINKEEW